jgi:DNA-directed RNA polymerase subunit RPC12/RpoP
MVGRYGVDELNRFLLILSLVAMIISRILGGGILYLTSVLVLGYAYFRMLSRNIGKRYRENMVYLKVRNRFLWFFLRGRNTINQRKNYHIYKCPGCGQKIRIPKGKGRVSITCPKCRKEFIKKS